MSGFRLNFLLAIFALSLIGILAWNLTARAEYESAAYQTIESEGKFEIREYPDLMLASTGSRPDAQGSDGSFMKLFGYISGQNQSEKKIAMTTPVFMQNNQAEEQGQMGFVMPKEVVEQGVPQPSASEVNIRKREGGRFAVVRFSGRMTKDQVKDAEAKLRAWMESKGLRAAESDETQGVETAGYDPPWTPGPLRRNELLIRLQ